MSSFRWFPETGPSRREFLQTAGLGLAVLSLPGALSCAHRPATRAGGAPGKNSTYFDAFGVDAGVLRRVIARGLGNGGDFAEVFLQHKITRSLGLEDGEVNRAFAGVDLGAGIRVLKGDATGFAYSEDLSEEALLAAAATAASVADAAQPGVEPRALAAVKVASRYAVEVPWDEVGVDKKLPVLQRTDRTARARDSRIIKVTASLNDETSHILVATSEGLLVEDTQPMVLLGVSCTGEHKGKTETGRQAASQREDLKFLSDETIDRVANQATDYTVLLFDAVAPPVGEIPVVLAPGISGILLHEAMGHGMEADFNRKGISIYAGSIGKKIAPEFVTIIDDATGRIRGSINVDDEGTGGERTVLVENGVLRSYMHDRISSKHYGVAVTGSGRRESFRFPPVPRMRNTIMLPGPHKPEEIIASVDKGLYAEVFSNGQVNIGAGDFTFYLKHGRLIEKGKLGPYVKDANLIGSGPKVLAAVQMVGDDLKVESTGGTCGKDGQGVPVGFGLPTVKAGAMSVGGRQS